MMSYYFVKRSLYGLESGRVERFAMRAAGPLLADGSIEPYDAKRHGRAPGADCVPADPAQGQVKPLKH